MESGFAHYYKKTVIQRPVFSLLIFFLMVAFFAYHGQNLKLDASAESIVLKNDPDSIVFSMRSCSEMLRFKDWLTYVVCFCIMYLNIRASFM